MKRNGVLTAQNMAREERFVKGIYTGTLRRIETTEQAEVFAGNRGDRQEFDQHEVAGQFGSDHRGSGFG
jgi:hypothetical protein